jgi:hypothetical protein
MVEKFGHHLDGLRVMSWSGIDDEPPVLVEPTDLRFSFTAAAVHYGLRLLETKLGQASLQKLGIGICQAWVTNDVFPSSTAAPIIRDMERLVNYYTSKLRNNFFTIVIMKTTISHGENVVADKERRPCQQYTGPENFDDDYYNPKDMGVFLLTNFIDSDEEVRLLAPSSPISFSSEAAVNITCLPVVLRDVEDPRYNTGRLTG